MVTPEPEYLVLPRSTAQPSVAGRVTTAHQVPAILNLPPSTLAELWLKSDSEVCELSREDFFYALLKVGERFNFGQSRDIYPNQEQRVSFLWHLRLGELALATACTQGRETAWSRFFLHYRAALTQAAVAIALSQTVGNDLADSLYAELYGLRAGNNDEDQPSPLAYYSGRGSLLGWLRATLAQRYINHQGRTRREPSFRALDAPDSVEAVNRSAYPPVHAPLPAHLLHLKHALTSALQALVPEDRFLLAAHFLEKRTLREMSAILNVREAMVSRRLKRLSADLRDELLHQLQYGGLSAQAAEEALGIDPRDLEINLRWLLQSSQSSPFTVHEGQPSASPEREADAEVREQP